MGFGILFVGYFAAMIVFLGALSVCRVLGGAIMAWAALKLRRYHRAFDLLLWASVISILFYGVRAVSELSEFIGGAALFSTGVQNVLAVIDVPLTFGFHICMLLGIRAIAKETEAEKVSFGAVRNIVFYCILLVLQAVSLLPFTLTRRLSVLAVLVSLILSVMNLWLIFRCYAQICDSEDAEMKQKPSRFAFVNRYREISEEKQRKADEEAAAYRKEKMERRAEKRLEKEMRKNGKR